MLTKILGCIVGFLIVSLPGLIAYWILREQTDYIEEAEGFDPWWN